MGKGGVGLGRLPPHGLAQASHQPYNRWSTLGVNTRMREVGCNGWGSVLGWMKMGELCTFSGGRQLGHGSLS